LRIRSGLGLRHVCAARVHLAAMLMRADLRSRFTDAHVTMQRACLFCGTLVAFSATACAQGGDSTQLRLRRVASVPAEAEAAPATVGGAHVLSGGSLALVDNGSHLLTLYAPSGRRVAAASLVRARDTLMLGAITGVASDEIYAYGVSTRRVHVFRVSGERLVETRSFPVPGIVGDMCMMADKLYVAAWSGGHIIQQFSRTGSPTGAFGEGFGSSASVREATLLSGARLACDASVGTVVLVRNALATVEGFDARGGRRFAVELPNVHSVEIRTVPNGVLFSGEGRGFDVVARALSTGRTMITLQVQHGAAMVDGRDHGGRLETLQMDARSGRVVSSQWDVPPLLAGGPGFVITRVLRPYLHVDLLAIESERQ
jgi:hypothetical protein